MIRATPQNLWDEIESSQAYIDKRLRERQTLIERYCGPAWGGDEDASIENHPYEYVSLVLPQLIYNNPQVMASSMRTTDVHRMVSSAIQQSMNRWIVKERLVTLGRQLCFDFLTSWGAAMLVYEENRRIQLPSKVAKRKGSKHPMWPRAYRISPKDYFFDPRASSADTRRWKAHRRLYDLDDLIEMAEANDGGGWDADAVRELQADDDPSGGHGPSEMDEGPDRRQVFVYELWLPENTKDNDDRENGTIYTLVRATRSSGEEEPVFIREPRPFYGPEWGPYYDFSAFYVSDEAAELAPLLATIQQQVEADEFASAFSRGAKSYKKILFTSDASIGKKMVEEPHLSVHVSDGAIYDSNGKPVFQSAEFGGATREQMDGVTQARERLERVTGLSDAMRGQTSGGDTTATEEQIAFQGGSVRVDELRQKFTECLTRMLEGVAWYMFTDEDFVIPMDGTVLGQTDAWFEGGAGAGLVETVGMTFDDLELRIEPYSMERISDSSRMARIGAAAQQAVQIGQAMAMMPWVNWELVVQDLGNAFNIPDYTSRFRWDVLSQVWQAGGANVQAMMQPSTAKTAQQSPPSTQGLALKKMTAGDDTPNGRRSGQSARQETHQA